MFPILAALAAAPQIIDAGSELVSSLSELFGAGEEQIKEAMELDPKCPENGKGIGLAARHNAISHLIASFQPGEEGELDESEKVLSDYIQLNLQGAVRGIESRMELIKMQNAMMAMQNGKTPAEPMEFVEAPNGYTPDGQVAASEPIQMASDDENF